MALAGDVLFTPGVRASFDLIGFDPRGIARSTQLQCFATTEDQLDVLPSMAFPVTRAEEGQWVTGLRAVSTACDRRGGPILDHMSTANVARDMDRIRLGLGESTLNFVGYSYGSMVGSTYANMFPDRVRAVVIDGVLDPVSWTTGRGDQADTLSVTGRLLSEQGAYETLQQFLSLCDAGGDTCAFSEGDPRQRFDRLARQLLADPVEVPDGNGGTVTVTYADLVSVTLGALYSSAIWPDLAALLADLDGLVNPAGAGAALTSLRARLAPRATAANRRTSRCTRALPGPPAPTATTRATSRPGRGRPAARTRSGRTSAGPGTGYRAAARRGPAWTRTATPDPGTRRLRRPCWSSARGTTRRPATRAPCPPRACWVGPVCSPWTPGATRRCSPRPAPTTPPPTTC